jgi:murein DD-endopeptidase MepM/ murein hydrolase activator NlpD
MNAYGTGQPSNRKSILKPLSTKPKTRSSERPTQPAVGPSQPDSQSTASRLTSLDQREQPPQSGSDTEKPDRAGVGVLVAQRVSVPVWLVAVLILALVSAPVLTLLLQSGSDGDSEDLPAAIEQPAPTESAAESDEADETEDIPLALELDPGFDIRQWQEPAPKPNVSSREQFMLDQGVNPDLEKRYAADEIERLQAELEAIQRNSAMLRSLARQQSGDLSEAYSSLEASQEHADGALEDLQGRIDDLAERIQSVDDLARELRDLLGMVPSDSAMGGPLPSGGEDEEANPWQTLREDVAHIEHWAGELIFDLDEINTEVQLRIARAEQAQAQAQAQAEAQAEAESQAEAQPQAPAEAPVDAGSSVSENLQFYDSMPMGWPVSGPITSRFGVRSSPFAGEGGSPEMHTGIDIAARTGTPVTATGGGTVQIAGNNGGYGLLVVINHGQGITSWYGHNSRLLVSPGQRVNAGDTIAEVGSTGRSTGPHVHYEVRVHGVPEDPLPYMQMSR